MQRRLTRRLLIACLLSGVLLEAQTAQPVISSISPSTAIAGSPGLTLSVSGLNFASGATVLWNGIALTTTFVSSTQLSAAVPANLLASPGTSVISVRNPDGRLSGAAFFSVTQPAITILSASLPAATVGVAYTATLQASGGTPPYVWTALDALPAGLTLAPSGVLSGVPTASGNFTFNVRVSDAQQATATRALTLTVSPPQFSITTRSPLPAATAGTPYAQTFQVSGGTPPYRWSASGTLPDGLTLDAAAGILRGTPQRPATFTFTIQVSDAANLSASASFTLVVNPAPLSITTESPLFRGTVGTFYSQSFSASGGLPPYRWSIASGQIPAGLSFDAAGALTGTPSSAGTYDFLVRVTDSAGAQASKSFSITVELPRLTILTAPSLPAGQVGVPYSQQLTATGGSPPYSWSIIAGSVPGLTLNPSTGVLADTPTAAGAFSFTVQVRDGAGNTATRTFTLSVSPRPLSITSETQLPVGAIGEPYSFALAASGGVPPYSWSANGLPSGLTLDAATGLISGAPRAAGALLFTVTLTDSAGARVTALFRITINLPPVPELQITGLPDTAGALEQPRLSVRLSAPYPVPISGQLTLSFTPETGPGDATVQFSSGGRSVDFEIPAEGLEAAFGPPQSATPQIGIQTGTVAGTITITARLVAAGVDVTPAAAPSRTIQIPRAAPVIRSAVLVRTSGGFEVRIVGFSTPREITQAVFRFRVASGATLQQSELSVPVENLFSRWYQDPAAARFGSQFLFTQPFTVQGGDANLVTPESVTLSNRSGSVTASVQ